MERGEFEEELSSYLRKRRRPHFGSFFKRVFRRSRPVKDGKSKTGLFSRLFKKKPAVECEADDVRSDMREIAKIALHAIKQLPGEKLRDFKMTSEFHRLKELLTKYGFIK